MLGVIVDDSRDVVGNLALDEALARAGQVAPLLRIWQNPSSVVVGRFQCLEREVDLAACARDRVPVLRRVSGGGTVYHDLGNLNVTLVRPLVPGGGSIGARRGALRVLRDLLLDVLRRIGLAARPADRGIFVGETKVSGLAAFGTANTELAHATLLVTTPSQVIPTYLAAASDSPHPLDSQRAPVASLVELGCRIDVADARAAVLSAAARRLGPLRPREPGEAELAWRDLLLTTRYADPTWHLTGRERRSGWTTPRASSSTG